MMRLAGLRLAYWCALLSFSMNAQTALPQLTLVKRIPFSEVTNHAGKALEPSEVADHCMIAMRITPGTEYGFIKAGKAFTPGWGGWVLDIESGTWKQELPTGLSDTQISRDDSRIKGVLGGNAA